MKLSAKQGADWVYDSSWKPQKRTLKSWQLFAKREAERLSRRDSQGAKNVFGKYRITWNAAVAVTDNGYVRLNFAREE